MKKSSVVFGLLLLTAVILLGFIAGKLINVPEQQEVPTQTLILEATQLSTLTATPLPTVSLLSLVPLISPPSDLLYEADRVLFYIDNQGYSNTLLGIPEGNTMSISHDGHSAILSTFSGENWYALKLIDFLTDSQVDLNPGNQHSFCGATQWPDRKDILLVYLEPKDDFDGMNCDGLPTILTIKNQELSILGTNPGPENSASISPDGRKVAFGNDGESWIYLFEEGTKKFDGQQYEFPMMESAYYSNPSWSPSEHYLAWVISGTMNGEDVEGVGVFDMEQSTSRFYYPYQVRGYDIRSSIMWNPDEHNITLVNRTLHTQWVIALEGGESTVLSYIPVWNPTGNKFAHLEYDRNLDQAFIVVNDVVMGLTDRISFPLEAEIHSWLTDTQLDWGTDNILYWDEYGEKLLWSPDGKYLIIRTGMNELNYDSIKWNWFVDIDNLSLYRLNLPEYAKIYQFIETEK